MSKQKRHDSWVTVQLSRVTGERTFFGSSVKSQSWIELKISTAERDASVSGQDRITGKGFGNLIEVALSPAQFAELLTTMNYGTGVPGTMTFFNGKRVEPYEEIENETTRVMEHFEKRLVKSVEKLKEQQIELRKIIQKKALSIADRELVMGVLAKVIQDVESNIPFYMRMYQETTDKIKTQMKSEVESFISNAISSAGLKALQDQKPIVPIVMIEGKKSDADESSE